MKAIVKNISYSLWRKYLQCTYLVKDLNTKYTKNFLKSTVRKKKFFLMGKRFDTKSKRPFSNRPILPESA